MMVLSYPWKYFAKIGTHEIKYELQLGIKRQFCYYETQLYSSIVTFIDQRFKGIFLPVIVLCITNANKNQKSKLEQRAISLPLQILRKYLPQVVCKVSVCGIASMKLQCQLQPNLQV